MKKNRLAKRIIRAFIKTIGVMIIFAAVAVSSFYLTKFFLKQTTRVERADAYTHAITINTGNESSNLIYAYDENTKKVKNIVLELFDATSKNVAYVTIPASTQITLSPSTYKQLLEVSPNVPQVATMSDINDYFTGDVAYEYGILILQEDLKADIGYFTALTTKEFSKYFKKKKKNNKSMWALKKDFLNTANAWSSAEDVEKYMESSWDNIISDLTLSQRQDYAKPMSETNWDFYRMYRVNGQRVGKVFNIDKIKARKLINKIWEAESYTGPQFVNGNSGQNTNQTQGAQGNEAQQTPNATNVEKNFLVMVYNGSGINGLAKKYADKISADGFKVGSPQNYTGDRQAYTTVYANTKARGQAIAQYINGAKVIIQDRLNSGADVELVLGTDSNY